MLFRVIVFKPEFRRDCGSVERKPASSQRSRPERQNIHAAPRITETLVVTGEHLEIRKDVVRPQDCLRSPGVGIAGDHGCRIAFCECQQRSEELFQIRLRRVNLISQPKPRVERNLLVSRTAGMDLVGERADVLLQLPNDQGVDVFIGRAFVKCRIPRKRPEFCRKPRRVDRPRSE